MTTVRFPFAIFRSRGYFVHGRDKCVQIILNEIEVPVVGVRDLRRNVTLADALDVSRSEIERGDYGVENRTHSAHNVGIGSSELVVLAPLSQLSGVRGLRQTSQLLLQVLHDDGDIVDGLLHLFVVALVGLSDQFVDFAVGNLSQDAIAFADGQKDGVQHGIHAANDFGVGALELLGLAAIG
jgi:hypothetical protein